MFTCRSTLFIQTNNCISNFSILFFNHKYLNRVICASVTKIWPEYCYFSCKFSMRFNHREYHSSFWKVHSIKDFIKWMVCHLYILKTQKSHHKHTRMPFFIKQQTKYFRSVMIIQIYNYLISLTFFYYLYTVIVFIYIFSCHVLSFFIHLLFYYIY